MSQKYKALRGFDVRVGKTEEFRRVAEIGDIITLEDVPEWGGKIPQSEIDAGVIELYVEPKAQDEVKTAALPVHRGGALNEGGDKQ